MAMVAQQVAHVHRRLGFGPTPADITAGVSAGPSAVIEQYLAKATAKISLPGGTSWQHIEKVVSTLVAKMAFPTNALQMRTWWILHGTVVIAFDDLVNINNLREHIKLFHDNAFGTHKANLRKVTTTTGMLKYLSGFDSTAEHPNENYARELMELFSLGITDPVAGTRNYTEADVKEIARALTGWSFNWTNDKPYFTAANWDPGTKTFLGRTFDGADVDDVIEAVSGHVSFTRFIPRRLYTELMGFAPSSQKLDELAAIFGNTGNLKPTIAAIVRSPEFLSDQAIGNKVKQPVELIASTARVLNQKTLDKFYLTWRLGEFFNQDPLRAPSVGGWPKGYSWMNSMVQIGWSDLLTHMLWYPAATSSSAGKPNKLVQTLFKGATPDTAAAKAAELCAIPVPSQATLDAVNTYAHGTTWTAERAGGVLNLMLLSPDHLTN